MAKKKEEQKEKLNPGTTEEKQTEKELEKLEKLQNDVLKQKERFNALIEDAHRVQKEAYEKEKEIEKRKAELDASYQEQLNEIP